MCDAGGEGLRAEVCVEEADGFAVGDAEAVVGGGEGLRHGVRGSAVAGVERLVVLVMRGNHHLGEVAAAAGAGIDVAGDEESLECGAVGGQAVGLREHGRLPRDTEPGKVFEHGGDEFRARALGVEVFVAEEEGAVVRAGAGVCGEERSRVAEVEQAGWRWREASDVVGGAHGVMIASGVRFRPPPPKLAPLPYSWSQSTRREWVGSGLGPLLVWNGTGKSGL